MPSLDFAAELAGLYRLDPRAFVPARDELARRLRQDGQREAAAEVRKARRPTLAAWAVNQLPRDGIGALLEAGAALRAAQHEAMSGALRAAELRAAADRRSAAVEELAAEATRLLRDAGHATAAHLDAVRATLLAASADAEAGQRVAGGRLDKELPAATSFGDLAAAPGGPGAPAPAPPVAPSPDASPASRPKSAAPAAGAAPTPTPERDERAARERAAAAAAIAAARRDLDEAEHALAAAESDVAARARALADARAEVERLQRRLDDAHRHAEDARRSAARARRRLDHLQSDRPRH